MRAWLIGSNIETQRSSVWRLQIQKTWKESELHGNLHHNNSINWKGSVWKPYFYTWRTWNKSVSSHSSFMANSLRWRKNKRVESFPYFFPRASLHQYFDTVSEVGNVDWSCSQENWITHIMLQNSDNELVSFLPNRVTMRKQYIILMSIK
jgi:hypothetical protein